jgi:hypothetical protein
MAYPDVNATPQLPTAKALPTLDDTTDGESGSLRLGCRAVSLV